MTASQQLTTATMKNIPCMPGAVHTCLQVALDRRVQSHCGRASIVQTSLSASRIGSPWMT
jgi:hypothetical protein